MNRWRIVCNVSVVGLASILAGCGSSQSTSSYGASSVAAPKVSGAATPAQQAMLLDQVKQLAGTWEMKAPDGSVKTIVYSVGSGGSTVREIMFPGEPLEMTNMYHMDGNSLLVTHYCSMGNQPRMRATSAQPGIIDFKLDSVTNLDSPNTHYMGGLRLVIKDKDHFREEWRTVENGKVSEGAVFELTRKN